MMKIKRKTETREHGIDKRGLLILACIVFAALLIAAATIPSANESAAVSTTTTFTDAQTPTTTLEPQSAGAKVEVYHFHRTSQCWSCKTLGALAEKTVTTYFKNELESGRLKFGHINVELAQNSELTDRYGASGSSLMIGVYKDGKFTKEEDTKVWYKLDNEGDYMSYLKGILTKRLNGDLS